jgi:pyruvate dehydrogenase E2 component (dihydrolipoamide acetyltransferase)
MPIAILMPALSPTMEQGKLTKWLVKEGDEVSAGDVIAEIETDKATMEVEAVDEGAIGRILVEAGTDGVAVNSPIAVLLTEGEDASALARFTPGEASSAATLSVAIPLPAAPSPAAPALAAQGAATPAASKSNGALGRLFTSPLARRLARQSGVDISAVAGSGPHGRIVRRDVDRALSEGTGSAVALVPASRGVGAPVPVPVAAAQPLAMPDEQILALFEADSYQIAPHDAMRKTIAARLTQAKATIPHFYLNIDCELDALLSARQKLNERAPKEGAGAYKLSVNDFIIKAMALALQRTPKANAAWTERGVLLYGRCDVAVAVAVEGGLFTPLVRDADKKSLAQISNEMKDLANRARKKRLAPHEYQGGTTSISNLGMYGIRSFDAVINPPHATILAAGAGEQRPVARDGQLKVATVMSVTLSCDHRVVDGALGAALLAAFKGFIEEPVTMLV